MRTGFHSNNAQPSVKRKISHRDRKTFRGIAHRCQHSLVEIGLLRIVNADNTELPHPGKDHFQIPLNIHIIMCTVMHHEIKWLGHLLQEGRTKFEIELPVVVLLCKQRLKSSPVSITAVDRTTSLLCGGSQDSGGLSEAQVHNNLCV